MITMTQIYQLPQSYDNKIKEALVSLESSLSDSTQLARDVLELSDFYQKGQQQTPWLLNSTQRAYLAYFFPLNYVRHLKVIDAIKPFFSQLNIECIIDFGFGLGASRRALLDQSLIPEKRPYWAIETSTETRSLYNFLEPHSPIYWKKTLSERIPAKSLGVFSYSLNELTSPPPWIFDFDALLIIEPSTQKIGRRLMEFRQQLIDHQFTIHAPCTHQLACPLLTHSKTDWCHDRIHWEQPTWFSNIEKHLPIKNKTLTDSYLFASKTLQSLEPKHGRIVSDELKEKGKTRWQFCRNDEREYLSWLDRSGPAPLIKRGDIAEIEVIEKKGNELRFRTHSKL